MSGKGRGGSRGEEEGTDITRQTSGSYDSPVDHLQEHAAAPVLSDDGVAANFQAGVHNANPTAEVSEGVWGEGFTKSG